MSEKGFSIVELMVALLLGLILTLGVMQVFLGNRQTQALQESVGRVQESGRLALEFISEDLRLGGFSGSGELQHAKVPMAKQPVSDLCADRTEKSDVLNVANGFDWYSAFTSNAVRVYTKSAAGAWSPSAPPSTASGGDIAATAIANARNGSDLIAIWYAVDSGAELRESLALATDKVKIKYTSGDQCFEKGELVMLSHTMGSVLFRVTNDVTGECTGDVDFEHAESTGGNCTASLGGSPYDQFSRVMKLQHRVYYVADTGRDNAAGEPVYALRRVANAVDDVELVEGIEFLKLTYGELVVNGSGVATGNVRYVEPGSVSSAGGITSARIGVLAQGLDTVRTDDDTNSYELPGGAIDKDGTGVDHGGGKTLRRVFVGNVELRNRGE